MPLTPPRKHAVPEPSEIGVGLASKAYQTALMMRQHWLSAYDDWFGRTGWTVADLQAMSDGIDADSIEHGGKRNAFDMLTAHHQLQIALRTALPTEVMADDPTASPVPYTLEEDEHGQRIVWDATADYPGASQ